VRAPYSGLDVRLIEPVPPEKTVMLSGPPHAARRHVAGAAGARQAGEG
jgi:hypothetical protein